MLERYAPHRSAGLPESAAEAQLEVVYLSKGVYLVSL